MTNPFKPDLHPDHDNVAPAYVEHVRKESSIHFGRHDQLPSDSEPQELGAIDEAWLENEKMRSRLIDDLEDYTFDGTLRLDHYTDDESAEQFHDEDFSPLPESEYQRVDNWEDTHDWHPELGWITKPEIILGKTTPEFRPKVGTPKTLEEALRLPLFPAEIILPDAPEPAPVANPKAFPLPQDKQARKDAPMAGGVLDYFKNALFEVARVSKQGNDQHNPGQPLHWSRDKSTDHADCIMRHLAERGTIDDDGQRHSAKLAWRALALLQTELEEEYYAKQ